MFFIVEVINNYLILTSIAFFVKEKYLTVNLLKYNISEIRVVQSVTHKCRLEGAMAWWNEPIYYHDPYRSRERSRDPEPEVVPEKEFQGRPGYHYSRSQSRSRRRQIIAVRKLGYSGAELKEWIRRINAAVQNNGTITLPQHNPNIKVKGHKKKRKRRGSAREMHQRFAAKIKRRERAQSRSRSSMPASRYQAY